jgi:hypothetical protein
MQFTALIVEHKYLGELSIHMMRHVMLRFVLELVHVDQAFCQLAAL